MTTDLPHDIGIRVAPTMLPEARNSMVEKADLDLDLLTDEYDELVCLLPVCDFCWELIPDIWSGY